MDRERTAFINLWISKCPVTVLLRQPLRRILFLAIFIVCLVAAVTQASSAWGEIIHRLTIPDQLVIPDISQIAASPDGYLWTLAGQDKIYKFDPSNSRFIVTVGGTGAGVGQFFAIGGIAVDNAGSVYATDDNLSRLQKFDSNGNFILKWKNFYVGPIAVDISNNVYGLHGYFVNKYNSKGELLTYWGGKGTGNGQFTDPRAIAVDILGNVYVADSGNHRIQKFDSNGSFLTKWGTEGSGDGQFSYTWAIAVDILGNVYVADSGNHRIQKFDSNGNFLTKWGTEGTGVAVDSSSNVYVSGYRCIWKFDGNGGFLEKWQSTGSEDGLFSAPNKAVADSAGNIYVADTGNHRIQKFDGNGNFLVTWGSYGSGDGQFSEPSHIAVNSSDDVYVVDRGNDRIQKFDSNGNFLAKWGSHGSNKGEFSYPNGVAVDSFGLVYVADKGNGRVQKFDGDGNFIKQWGIWLPIYHCYTSCFFDSCSDDCTDEWFPNPTDIAVDTTGNVYLLHSGISSRFDIDSQVIKYDSNGLFLTRWGSPGSGAGQFALTGLGWGPKGIATDSADNIYVADTDNNRIQKFGSKGNFLAAWGISGTGAGQFVAPHGISVDSAGNIYVTDTGNNRIQKFEQTFKIKGAVKKANGIPMTGVLMSLSGDANKTAITDSFGKYTFKNVSNGSYTVTPSKTGFDFTPASTDVTIYGNHAVGKNFTGATFSISGAVKKANGSPIAGVLMSLSGDASKTVTTDSNGSYKFNRVTSGNYTIVPDKAGFTFAPTSITLNISGASVKKQDFTGTKD